MYQHPDCCKYGCSADLLNNKVRHSPNCPQNPVKPAGDAHRFNEPGLDALCQACGLTKEFAPPKCDNRLYAADVEMLEAVGVFPKREPGNNIKSLALARAQKGQLPDHGPAMAALDLARDWIEESGQDPSHIIVFIARDHDSGGDGIKFFQAGSYRPHAQAGMVFEGLDVLRSTGRIEYGN